MLIPKVLEGWLVFIRWNANLGSFTAIPDDVVEGLLANEWITLEGDPEEEILSLELTPAGLMQSDLCAPEWGVDSLPVT